MDEHDDWDETEREALRAMAQAPPPPEVLERVLEELGRSGHLRQRRLAAWTLSAAASVALFVGGLLVGERRASPAGDPRPLYMLLLYDVAVTTPQEEAARVSEYGAWARRLHAAGHLKAGEKLKDEAFVLGPPVGAAEDGRLGGYFLVAAADLEQALAIARDCPHVRHGGRVVVRPLDLRATGA
jgi:hypothetical protein